jgi:hypothetical protein
LSAARCSCYVLYATRCSHASRSGLHAAHGSPSASRGVMRNTRYDPLSAACAACRPQCVKYRVPCAGAAAAAAVSLAAAAAIAAAVVCGALRVALDAIVHGRCSRCSYRSSRFGRGFLLLVANIAALATPVGFEPTRGMHTALAGCAQCPAAAAAATAVPLLAAPEAAAAAPCSGTLTVGPAPSGCAPCRGCSTLHAAASLVAAGSKLRTCRRALVAERSARPATRCLQRAVSRAPRADRRAWWSNRYNMGRAHPS